MTSGELIHRFRRKTDWDTTAEWDDDLKRIVDTVTAEAKADARAAVIEEVRAEAKAREEWGLPNSTVGSAINFENVADWLESREGKSDVR